MVDLKQEAIRKKLEHFNIEVRKNASVAVSAAFALLIALAWKDVIAESVDKIVEVLQMPGNTYLFRFVSALIVTVVCVMGIWFSSKIAAKEEQK